MQTTIELGELDIINLIYYILVIHSGYILVRLIGKHPRIKYPEKKIYNEFLDFTNLFIYSMCLYFTGNYINTFNNIVIISYFCGIVVFSVLEQISSLKFNLNELKELKPLGALFMMIEIILMVASFGYHLYLANEFIDWYMIIISTILLTLIISFTIFKNNKNKIKFHLHYWQFFYILSILTRFDDIYSQISAGICLGLFTHGVSKNGFENIFNTRNILTDIITEENIA